MKNLKLTPCKNCGNPFFRDENNPSEICKNCIKLEERRKRTAPLRKKQDEMRKAIEEMKFELIKTRSELRKKEIKQKIQNKSDLLTKSVELLQKYEETGDESFIDEYQRIFEQLKKMS